MEEIQLPTSHCAYERCQKTERIEAIPGHRRRQYHDEACRQAQHRLLEARRIREQLRQHWSQLRSETQLLLDDLLDASGEAWTQRVLDAMFQERDQALQPVLTEDGQASFQAQWATFQPVTRHALEGALTSKLDALRLLTLVTLAIDVERQHAICNSELERRNTYLETTFVKYRRLIDLEDREKIEQQFLVMGELLGYRAIPKYRLGAGVDRWQDYRSWTDETTLAEVIRDAKDILGEEEVARNRAKERSWVREVEQELAAAQQRIADLERKIEKQQQRIGKQQMQYKSRVSDVEQRIEHLERLCDRYALDMYLNGDERLYALFITNEKPECRIIPLRRDDHLYEILSVGRHKHATARIAGQQETCQLHLTDEEMEIARKYAYQALMHLQEGQS